MMSCVKYKIRLKISMLKNNKIMLKISKKSVHYYNLYTLNGLIRPSFHNLLNSTIVDRFVRPFVKILINLTDTRLSRKSDDLALRCVKFDMVMK